MVINLNDTVRETSVEGEAPNLYTVTKALHQAGWVLSRSVIVPDGE